MNESEVKIFLNIFFKLAEYLKRKSCVICKDSCFRLGPSTLICSKQLKPYKI